MKETTSTPNQKGNSMSQKLTEPINRDDVLSVYNGEAGKCCCGCAGKHSYPKSGIARQVAGKKRGYPITDDECSDRSVTFVVNKINANLADAQDHGDFVCFDTPTRTYIAYKVQA